jgi:hypothetical protein
MSKIEFPIGVELPLRGGGVAVLYEFHAGEWFGRFKLPDLPHWYSNEWGPSGSYYGADEDSPPESERDILPPKRKAWVVWYPADCISADGKNKPAEIVRSAQYASLRAKELGGTWQEISEP